MNSVKSKLFVSGLTIFSLLVLTPAIQAENAKPQSPIDKGSINLGGTFSLQSSGGDLYEYDGDRETLTMFFPGGRYFIKDNIAVGGDITYIRMAQGDDAITTLGIGPAAAYFFRTKSDKFYPYLGLGIFYSNYSFKSGTWDTSASGFDFRFGGGLAYMLGKNLAIVFELTYHIQSLKPEEGDSESGNIIAFSVGFAGFLY